MNRKFYQIIVNVAHSPNTFWSFLYFEPNIAVWNPKANPDKETRKPSNIVENMSDKTSKRLTFPGKLVKLHLCAYS